MTCEDNQIPVNQPFQFSLGRLFAAIALVAVCLWLLRAARDSPENRAAATAVIPLALGLAIGSLLGRAGVGAAATVVVYGAVGLLLFQLEGASLHGRRPDDAERRQTTISANASRDDFIILLNLRGSTPNCRAVAAQKR